MNKKGNGSAGVLFDLDGTLVDTRPAIKSAYLAAIDVVLGITLLPDDDHMQDMLRRRPLEYFSQHYGAHAQMLENAYRNNYVSSGIQLYPGILDMLCALDAARVPFGIVTNKARERVLSDLTFLGLSLDRFEIIFTAEDSAQRKPHPRPIEMAVEQLRWSKRLATYVGDGPHDIVAAKAASVRAVGVTWGYYFAEQLSAEEPHALCHDAEGLYEKLFDGQ
jgi:HAD superfamily hydrolase (TIGR01549 family)